MEFYFKEVFILQIQPRLDNADRKYLFEMGFRSAKVAKYAGDGDLIYVVGADPNVRVSMVQQWHNHAGWRYCTKTKSGYVLQDATSLPHNAFKLKRYGLSKIYFSPGWYGRFAVVQRGSIQVGVDDEVLMGDERDVR